MTRVLLVCSLAIGVHAAWGQAPAATPGKRDYTSDPGDMGRRAARFDVPTVYRGSAEDTLATIRQRGVLRVGVVPGEPMVMVSAKGELSGYSVDLARRLADDLGLGLEFVQTSWPQVVPDLLSRQFDLVLSGLWVTMPRALVVNFTQPTVQEGIYLVASQKLAPTGRFSGDFNKPEVRIAVDADTVQAQVAKRVFPNATLVTSEANPLEAVRTGRVHATLLPTMAPARVAEKGAGQIHLPLDTPLASTSAAMAIRKGDADFLNLLNTWLSLQRDEGWLADRASHWSAQFRSSP